MTEHATDLRQRILAWERLRIMYNVVMLAAGVPVAIWIYGNIQSMPEGLRGSFLFSYSPLCMIGLSVVFGIAANLAFTLGPMAEVYVVSFTRFRIDENLRLALFVAGLVFSLGVQALIAWFYWMLALRGHALGFD